jgi:hypothetical protein
VSLPEMREPILLGYQCHSENVHDGHVWELPETPDVKLYCSGIPEWIVDELGVIRHGESGEVMSMTEVPDQVDSPLRRDHREERKRQWRMKGWMDITALGGVALLVGASVFLVLMMWGH